MTEQKKILTLNAKWILINCNNCCVLQNFCHFWGHLSENFGKKCSQTGNRTRAAWVKARNPNP